MELVTGATGYVGGRLIERLLADGREVRAVGRDSRRLERIEGVEHATADLLDGRGRGRALDGVATAYYLVHSMEPARAATNRDGDFGARDRRAATSFGEAAAKAGVER